MLNNIPKDVKIISFDVFDTCLARFYEKPSDLFFALGLKIAPPHIPREEKIKFAISFFKSRILAEQKCNIAHGKKRSCHFDEIYRNIDIPYSCNLEPHDVAKLELQLEYENLYAIKKTLSMLENYRKLNARIIFISDMYLDKEFVKKLLIQHGFFKENDKLYISSQNTLTKRSGDLFKKILLEEKIHPRQLLHHGDDIYADIKIPKKIGINTKHISNTHCWPSEIFTTQAPVNPESSKLNGFSKFLRQTKFFNRRKPQLEVFNTATTLLMSFVLWVFEKALEKNIDTLYFLAKDNDITYKIAVQLNSLYPSIKVKYLYGSRRAWLLPSIELNDNTWKKMAVPDGYPSSVVDALQRINFTPNEIEKVKSNSTHYSLVFNEKKSANDCLELLDTLFRNEKNNKILAERVEISRRIFIKYLEQEGLFNENWGIVDTGWQLNCQAALKRVINRVSKDKKLVGFYLGLSHNHLSQVVADVAYSFTEIGSIFSKRPLAVEHIFFPSTHASTTSYVVKGETISPEFADDQRSPEQIAYTNDLQEYALCFAQLFKETGLSHHLLINLRRQIIEKAEFFLKNPDRALLSEIQGIRASEDARHSILSTQPLFQSMKAVDIIKITLRYTKNKDSARLTWAEASLVETGIIFGVIIKLLFFLRKSKFVEGIEYTNKEK